MGMNDISGTKVFTTAPAPDVVSLPLFRLLYWLLELLIIDGLNQVLTVKASSKQTIGKIFSRAVFNKLFRNSDIVTTTTSWHSRLQKQNITVIYLISSNKRWTSNNRRYANNKRKQWKYCWYLDFFIMFGLLIVKIYVSFLF